MILKIVRVDDIIKDRDIHSVHILLDKKSYETYKNVLIYNILYKTSTDPKPLRIRFHKIDRFIRVFDFEIKHFVLFDYRLSDKLYDKIKCLVSEKSGTATIIHYNFKKIRIYSSNSLPIEKILIFHDVIILISNTLLKSVVNKNKSKRYHNIFL